MQEVTALSRRGMQAGLPRLLLLSSLLVTSVSCGGGDSNSNDGGGNATFGMSWADAGAADKSVGAKASFGSSAGADSYEINGVGELGTVTVEVTAATPMKAQTFECGKTTAGQKVRVSYYPLKGGVELTDRSCTVTLSKAGGVGDTVVGTFEAVISLRDGGTKAISGGKFNLHVSAL